MFGTALIILAMLANGASAAWQDDGSVVISVTFEANDPGNPFPQGEELLAKAAVQTCEGKGAPEMLDDAVVNGISMASGKPVITMSGTYACR